MDGRPLPLYGDGRNVRDWLFVRDHAEAIDFLLDAGNEGETYNVAGGNERENLEVTERILDQLGKPRSLIRPTKDRVGHDRRYSLDGSKLRALGFKPEVSFEDGLKRTVAWYRDHEAWWRPIKESGAALQVTRTQYEQRLATSSATAKNPG